LPDNDFQYYFNTILIKGRKDNAYKFALARFLIEYSSKQTELDIETRINNNESYTIKYSVIAQSFLKYFWHQICKYKIRQNHNLEELPLIGTVLTLKILPRLFEKFATKSSEGTGLGLYVSKNIVEAMV
jgi:signal transduction histidine kinase